LFESVQRSVTPPHAGVLCAFHSAKTLASGAALLMVAVTMDEAEPAVVTRARPDCSFGVAEPDAAHALAVRFVSGACDASVAPLVPVNVSHTNVSAAATVSVDEAVFPPASVAVTVAVPKPYPMISMLPPVVATSFATAAFEVVQANVADGTALFDESRPCAASVCLHPSFTVAVAGVTAACVIVGGAVTVTVACANVPFVVAVAVRVAVPPPVGVTVTVDPLVVLNGAAVVFVVVQVNGTPVIAVFVASNASATNCCVCAGTRFALAGVIVTRFTVAAAFTVIAAVANCVPELTVMDVLPIATALATMVAPVVADTLAIAEFADDQLNVTDGSALFDASNACAVRLTVSPTLSVFDVGVTVTRVTTGETVTVAAATCPPALTLMFVVPAPAPVAETEEPVVALNAAIDALTVLHVKVTPDITTFDASNACAVKLADDPTEMFAVVGVIVTRVTAGETTTVAAAVCPPALALMLVVPAPAPVAETEEPVVALNVAIEALTMVHVNVTPDINAFDASNACAVKLADVPTEMFAAVGVSVTRDTVTVPATVADTSADNALWTPPVLYARSAKKYC